MKITRADNAQTCSKDAGFRPSAGLQLDLWGLQYAFWSRQTTARVLPMIMRSNSSDPLRMVSMLVRQYVVYLAAAAL
jgi:hypothetical protein